MKPIILASSSPRRKEILEQLGVSFAVDPSSFEEDMTLAMSPRKLAQHLAYGKAHDVVTRHDNAYVIGADTFLTLDDLRLGKPKDEKHAIEMLVGLSARSHNVITGMCVIDTKKHKKVYHVSVSNVYMRDLSQKDIDWYIGTHEWEGKAGAYAIQGKGSALIKKIVGDYNGIVGLSMVGVIDCFAALGERLLIST